MKHGKAALLFLSALVALFSVICSTLYANVTNDAMMREGFLQYANTNAFGVPAKEYAGYATSITNYLKGQGDCVTVKNAAGETVNAFSDKENAHLKDVRGIVTFLLVMRWGGILGAVAVLAAMFFAYKKDKNAYMNAVLLAFSRAALALLAVLVGLLIWGIANFSGLFWTFHRVAFTNDLWLLNPSTDLLIALMPIAFFTWYGGQLLRALAPVCLIILVFALMYGKIRKGLQ